ncbi:glucan biosynthesis protein D [soil metagenome]
MKTHLVLGLITIALLAIVISSRQKETFTFENVAKTAETMARNDYMSTSRAVPRMLRNLNYDQVRDIRWKDDLSLWRKEGLPFQIRFYHPGNNYSSVEIYVKDPGQLPVPVKYSPDFFDFGKNVFGERLPDTVGYAGFRVHYPINKPDVLDEVLVCLGASYFRAIPKDLVYGASARGLAIDTGIEKRTEEFPVFTKFWLVRPPRSAKQFTFYALMESKSVIGAYQFEVEPGVETRMHVKAVLYFRKKLENIGIAPLTSMYWYGENTSNTFGNFRPEVHDSDGLLMQRGNGEWVWHPLAWARQTEYGVFADDHPKGFGLMQRDRDFNHYQDTEAKYHLRPSVWVQPLNGFDQGSIRLIQLPTNNEYSDNIVAFWTPAQAPRPLQPVTLEYNLRWLNEASDLPPLGRCLSTRVDYQDAQYYRHFFLDFAGGPLDGVKPDQPPAVDVSSPTGGEMKEVKIEWNDYNKNWRVSFIVSTADIKKPCEILCRLTANGKPLTETWSYTWTP